MPFFEYNGAIQVSNIKKLVLVEFQWDIYAAALNIFFKYRFQFFRIKLMKLSENFGSKP